MPLDSLTFEKIVSQHEYVLVKFDTAYPFGDLHDEWKEIAQYTARNSELIAAEVNINEYGDRENQDLAFKYDVGKEDYPVYKLFNRETDPDTATPFEGSDRVSLTLL